jgi:HAE1 family hydrophobic/amphiphilic exporter-1
MSSGFLSLPIRRPVLTTVIYIIIILVGLFSLWRLPIDLMPEITNPVATVITNYGNAGPQEMEELITRPLESSLAGIQGIEEISSTSSEGVSRIRVRFVWGTNLDEAVNDIRDRIDRTLNRLPDDVERPFIRKFDVSSFPIMMLGVSSELDPIEVRQLIDDQVQYRLERCPGVASVDIRGGESREISVALKASALEALKISPDMIINTFQQENRNIPAGTIYKGNKEVIVRTFAEYNNLDDVRSAIIAVRDGVPVTIGDVADVSDGMAEITSIVRINQKPGIRLSVTKQSGVNTVAVANGVLKEIERINRDIPQLKIIPLSNNATFIENSIKGIGNSLMIGGTIAILVLILFLRNVSSTIIIATTIPVSIIATFALIYFGGLTLNMMTFGGLALGIGMLVDNSIVVLDNIFHHRENGANAIESSFKGSSEVISAVFASTMTTLVVFFPVVFIRGISGIMFRQLAYVVSFSLACSLFAAITLVPMLSSRFLKMKSIEGEGNFISRFFKSVGESYDTLEQFYGRVVNWALHHRKTVLAVSLILFIVSVLMVPLVGMELMPSADESEVRVNVEMEVGTRLELLDSTVSAIESVISREVPEAIYVVSSIGGGGWGSSGGHTAEIRISLVSKTQRNRSSAQIADRLRVALRGIPGTVIRVREGQGLFLLRMGTNQGNSVDVELRGYDLQTGQQLAEQVAREVSDVQGVTDAKVSREAGMPEFVVRINRKKAADLGFSAYQIGNAIQTAMGGTQATSIRRDGKEYNIMVRLAKDQRLNVGQLANLSLVSKSGVSVTLQNVAEIIEGNGPVQIERRDRERIVTVSINYAGRDLGSVVEDIRSRISRISIPSDFAVLIRGDYEEQQKAYRELIVGIVLAIMLVYLVMAGQFESFKDPLIILFSIPMALIGVVAILFITGTPFSVQAFIGCIILTGIVVNNAIILIDFMNRLRREQGFELREAIVNSAIRRLRPILMSTSTTVLGLFPLALALGEGGETQAPMARVVIGGLFASSLITLVLIPVIYSIVEERHTRKKALKNYKNAGPVHVLIIASIICLSAFFNLSHAQSDSVLKISLEDALNRAVSNNPLIRIERIDVDFAEAAVKENRYRFEPTLNFSYEQKHMPDNKDSSELYHRGTVSIEEYLPSGTNLKFSAAATPRYKRYQQDFELSVTQSLLQGGWSVNLVPLKRASIDLELRQEELAAYAQKLIAETESAYWDAYLAEQEISIYQQSMELARRLLNESNERLRVGKIAPIDLIAVRAEVASREKDLINSQASLKQKKYRLAYLINDSLDDWEKPVIFTDKPPEPKLPDSLGLHQQVSKKYRPDLRQAHLLAKRGELEIVQTKNGLLPKLDLFLKLGGTAYTESFSGFLENPYDQKIIGVGANLSIPVTNGIARQKYRKAQLSQKQLQLSLENIERLVELDVRSAWTEVERALQMIEKASTNRLLQQEKLAAEQARLAAGKTTEYVVLQVQRDLTVAQLDEARAAVAYVKALTDLYLKDGTLLERRGVNSNQQ